MSMRPVLESFACSLAFLRDQVADVPAEDLAAQPPGETRDSARDREAPARCTVGLPVGRA